MPFLNGGSNLEAFKLHSERSYLQLFAAQGKNLIVPHFTAFK
jgi:hypothetical protein